MLNIQLKTAETPKDFADAQKLILEYAASLGFDLAFQNFDQEMADLPNVYNKNDGGLYLGYLNHFPAGVVGLRRFSETEAELKRMYVSGDAKRKGIGRMLLRKCIETARQLGYKTIKLDTASYMDAAIKLYTDHGFVETGAYRFNPHDHARYFELDLLK